MDPPTHSTGSPTKRNNSSVFQTPHRVHSTHKSNEIIAQSEPREDQIERLIDQLDVNPEFPNRRMTASVNIIELDSRMNSGEEGTV